MMFYEGISVSNGGVVKINKNTVSFTEPSQEEMSKSRREDTIALLSKWNHFDQEYKSMICEYQETLKGNVLNLQATIGRGGMDK